MSLELEAVGDTVLSLTLGFGAGIARKFAKDGVAVVVTDIVRWIQPPR